jgi:beta-galactosidase
MTRPLRALAPLFLLLLPVSSARAEETARRPKLDTILYGASYYPEYMPHERLEKDVALMEKAGVTVVRMGESTWSSFEPRDGEFEFAWMDRILDRLHRAGIKVVFGTPTYSIPPWLYKEHPEIQLQRLGDHFRMPYGRRQQVELGHPCFRRHAERVIRQVVGHFKDQPAIIGWQLDNETEPRDQAGPGVQARFDEYLKAKFGTVDAMNKAWGFVYWGQLVGSWDELPDREGILNPGYKLEWERYQRKIVTDFLAWQASIVDELRRPDQFITHNFVGGVRTSIDQPAIARHLDVVGANPYYKPQDDLDGWYYNMTGDLARSLKRDNYLVTETNAQTIGWDSKGQFPPYDGQLRLNVYGLVATGANMVAYWHWHSLHYGQETYWKGVLSHDLEPNRVYAEMSRVGAELERVGPALVNLKRTSRVAILLSVDSYQGIRFMPFSDDVDYMTILRQLSGSLYRLNVSTDFVFPETTDLSAYDVIVVPPLYVADDALLRRLADYAEAGGQLVLTFKSGFTNEDSTVRWERMPGPLRAACGFSYQEFSSLTGPLPLKGDPFGVGGGNEVSVWAEMIQLEGATALAWYEHPFFERYPAITRHEWGKGTVTYEGTVLSDALQDAVLLEVLKRAGLTGPDQELPDPVRVRHATGNDGRALHFYLDYSAQDQAFEYAYGAGTDLLTGNTIVPKARVTVGPWDLVIVRESR